MSVFLRSVLLVILFFSSLELFAADERSLVLYEDRPSFRHKKMLCDLDFITNIFEISYAPAAWKTEFFGWDLDAERENAKNLVRGNLSLSLKEFQRMIKDFCLTTKDYHVVPQFYSTEWSSLPFHIQSVNGRYFVTDFDQAETYFSSEPSLMAVGDEVLFVDGRPIDDVVKEFWLMEIGNNSFATDKALAEFYFTTRLGSSGHEVPSGEVELIYCDQVSNDRQVCKLKWNYRSEIICGNVLPSPAKSLSKSQPLGNKDPFQKQFMSPHYNLIRSVCADNSEPSDLLGSRRSRVPLLGTVLWESEESEEFHAYLFLMEDWKIGGYIRISSYYVDGDSAAMEFAENIELFEEVTDVLVIDQLNNGGGYVFYLYALAAMLTDRELEVPMHRVMLTQEDVYYANKRNDLLESIKNDRGARKKLGDTIEGYVVNYKLAKCLLNSHLFIVDQWNSGKLFTDYSYLYGIETIMPHPEVNYTKPILVLTNGLDFSAADFFPAIMQDNGRAKIMGTRTAGAGGYIEKISFPNLSGIDEIDVTASFSRRQNGMPIENFGVTPDVIYEISQNDLQNNYVDYKQKILDEVRSLLSED